MDEQNRDADIRQYIRERLTSISLRHNKQINIDTAVRQLNEQFSTLSRRDKGDVRRQLDRDQLSRRDFLKLLGVTSIGTAAAIGFIPFLKQELGTRTDSTGYAGHCGYRTLTLDQGEERMKRIGSGETFENVLIDQTADGASFRIRANGDDWVIRNVGWLGEGSWSGHGGFQISAATSGNGNGLIENVYMNQMSDGPTDSAMGGIFAQRKHAGQIDIRHTYIQGFGNNAAYCSDPGQHSHGVAGSEGTIVFENCYHRDCTPSLYRIGTPGSAVRNCVGVVNDPENNRGGYPNNGSRNTRCMWGRHFPDLTCENCSFYVNPDEPSFHATFMATHIGTSKGSECVLNAVNCDVNEDTPQLVRCSKPMGSCENNANADVQFENLGHNPTLEVIGGGGVPTEPEEAACGGRGTPPAPDEVIGTPREGANSGVETEPC